MADVAANTVPASRPAATAWRAPLRTIWESRFAVVLVMLVLLLTFFTITQDRFLTTDNVRSLLTSVSILWVVAIGLTFVLLVGGFDLSIGSTLALSGIVLSWLYNDVGLPVVPAMVATVAFGALIGGLLNGVLVGRFEVSFLVVTLGTQSLLRGLVNLFSDTKSTPVVNPLLDDLAFGRVLGVPVPVLLMVVVLAVSAFVLRRTYFGRDVYAVGGNAQAARLSGINVPRTVVIVYAIAGAGAALAGVLQVSRIGSASPLVGETIVFDATAAVLLGGTSFRGGSGGVIGTAVGVLFLGVLSNGLAIAGVASFWQQILTGLIVVTAAVVDKLQRDGVASLGFRIRWRER